MGLIDRNIMSCCSLFQAAQVYWHAKSLNSPHHKQIPPLLHYGPNGNKILTNFPRSSLNTSFISPVVKCMVYITLWKGYWISYQYHWTCPSFSIHDSVWMGHRYELQCTVSGLQKLLFFWRPTILFPVVKSSYGQLEKTSYQLFQNIAWAGQTTLSIALIWIGKKILPWVHNIRLRTWGPLLLCNLQSRSISSQAIITVLTAESQRKQIPGLLSSGVPPGGLKAAHQSETSGIHIEDAHARGRRMSVFGT